MRRRTPIMSVLPGEEWLSVPAPPSPFAHLVFRFAVEKQDLRPEIRGRNNLDRRRCSPAGWE